MGFDDIVNSIQADGYKDFITYVMLIIIIGSFVIYLIQFVRKEISNDTD